MSENIKHISDASFEADVLKSEKPVLVDFWAFRDLAAYDGYRAVVDRSPRGIRSAKTLPSRLQKPPETLRLSPTARSLLGR